MVAVRNITAGWRGAYLAGELVMANPGEVIEADDFPEEWFEEVGENDDLAGKTVAQLRAIAEAEGVDLGDVTRKADIIAAIELAREA